jgi:hypothetical protein
MAAPLAATAPKGARLVEASQALKQLFLLAPAIAVALITLPMRYDVTLAEPDLVRMMAGFVYGGSSGLHLSAGMHYGHSFSFGYYNLLYALAPAEWLHSPDRVAALMNGFGAVSGILCAWACTVYLDRLFGWSVALAAAVLFVLSPVMLPLVVSGHPIVPAAACVFAAGLLLLNARAVTNWQGWVALLLLVVGLCFRAEIALAFPFLWLARARDDVRAFAFGELVVKGAILALSFVVFLVLQRLYVTASGGGGSLGSFIATFASPSRMARGVVVLVFAAGMVTVLAAALSLYKLRWRHRGMYLALVLAAPALALWLPNPQPARHFFFVVLAICLFLALRLDDWLKGNHRHLLLAGCAVVIGNQVVAEVLHPVVVAKYSWSYPSVTERRATQQVPIGAFPFDQRSNQQLASLERDEAIGLARQAPERLLVLADSQSYIIAHLLEAHPGLAWREWQWNGITVSELKSPEREIVLLEKLSGWPKDVAAEVLGASAWKNWPIYVQPTTVSAYDRTPIPAERRFDRR